MHTNKTVLLIDNAKNDVRRIQGSPFWFVYTPESGEAIRNVAKMKVESIIMETGGGSVMISFPQIGIDIPCVREVSRVGAPELMPVKTSIHAVDFPLPCSTSFNKLEVKISIDGTVLPTAGGADRVVLLLTVYHTVRDEEPLFDLQKASEDSKMLLLTGPMSFTWYNEDVLRHVRKLSLVYMTLSADIPLGVSHVRFLIPNIGIDWPVAVAHRSVGDAYVSVIGMPETVWERNITLSKADVQVLNGDTGEALTGSSVEVVLKATYLKHNTF